MYCTHAILCRVVVKTQMHYIRLDFSIGDVKVSFLEMQFLCNWRQLWKFALLQWDLKERDQGQSSLSFPNDTGVNIVPYLLFPNT